MLHKCHINCWSFNRCVRCQKSKFDYNHLRNSEKESFMCHTKSHETVKENKWWKVKCWSVKHWMDGWWFFFCCCYFSRRFLFSVVWKQTFYYGNLFSSNNKNKTRTKKKKIVIHKTNIQTLLTRARMSHIRGGVYNIRLEQWIYRKIVRRTMWRLKIDLKIGICVTENKLK